MYVYCAVASLGEATTFCHDIDNSLPEITIESPYVHVTDSGITVQYHVLFDVIVAV
ncbi:hypothetical protein IKI14_06955 [bacterium]|nr:hypothetical protein [bacterium]